jgi:uncharacterized protein (TIGR00369 family)
MTDDDGPHLLSLLGMQDAPTPPGADLAVSIPVTRRVTNPSGSLQGGLLATLVDVTAGRAANQRVGPGRHVPTADMTIHYLAPVLVGPALAVARVRRAGRSTVVVQVDVHDAGRDVLAATATLAFAVLDAKA